MKTYITLFILTLGLLSIVHAGTYIAEPEYSVGSGSSAMIAIDFDYDNSFVFEFCWEGQATGWDALMALDAAGGLDVLYTDYGWGVMINDFIYPGGTAFSYASDEGAFWAYYTSTDSENWTSPDYGVQDRILEDGAWDSWVWSNSYFDPDTFEFTVFRGPGEKAVHIPEPATMVFLTAGILTLRKKTR